jgi:hypothetical protein
VALGALWLPTLLPLAMGPLTECGHCIRNYVLLMPIMPGIVAAMLVQGVGGIVMSALVTVLEALVLVAWMRRGGVLAWSGAGLVAVVNALLSLGLSYGLRM